MYKVVYFFPDTVYITQQIWHRASSRERNHVGKFFVDRFRGFDSVGGQNLQFSID